MFQVNHMKNQALFSSRNRSKKKIFKCRLLQFLFGSLRVNLTCSHISVIFLYGSDAFCMKIQLFLDALVCFLTSAELQIRWGTEDS